MYVPDATLRTDKARRLIGALAGCDAVIIASPGYHGGPSGLIKNALDYVEDLRDDERPYFDGRAVGCIACAAGWQATTTTLIALRSIVHALRGWPHAPRRVHQHDRFRGPSSTSSCPSWASRS